MSFSITIDFDLTPEDLEILKAIGERAKGKPVERILCYNPADDGSLTKIADATYHQAIKDLLREAIKHDGFHCHDRVKRLLEDKSQPARVSQEDDGEVER